LLRAARYRSAMSYLDLAVITLAQSGWRAPPDVEREVQRSHRACKRGFGPQQQATPLPVERISEILLAEAPLVPDGPCWAQSLLTVGSWWLTREIDIVMPRWHTSPPTAWTFTGVCRAAKQTSKASVLLAPTDALAAPNKFTQAARAGALPGTRTHRAGRLGERQARGPQPFFPDGLRRSPREKSRGRHDRRRSTAHTLVHYPRHRHLRFRGALAPARWRAVPRTVRRGHLAYRGRAHSHIIHKSE
jgi:hypothetical protein